MRRSATLVLVVLFALAVISGCGRSKKTVYSAPGGKVKVTESNSPLSKEKTVTAESKEGKMEVTAGQEKAITEAELGAPVYPGAKSSFEGKYESKKPGENASVQQHILSTPDDFDKVVAFYKSKLKNVKNEQTMSTGDGRMAMLQVGEGKDQMMVHIVSNPKEKVTTIQVIKGGH